MNRTEQLRVVAEQVVAALPGSVTDVVVTGSVSRGVADELSDVELLVICDEPPVDVPLDEVERWTPPVDGAHWVGGMFGGEFVELIWWTSGHVEERVRAIAAGEIVDWPRLKTAEAIVNGIALRGTRHEQWCAQLAAWPPGLTESIIEDAAARWAEPPPRSMLRAGDALALAWQVVEDAENVLRIVFALNCAWPPSWKRLAQRVAPLAVKPDRLAERVDGAVRALDLNALRVLAREALELGPRSETTHKVRARLQERV